ncbi:MAG: radical SAM protein, partial [Planctomycetota bacterium]
MTHEQHDTPPPNPLGLTLDAFRSAVNERGFGPGQSQRAYRAFFRGGPDERDAELETTRNPSGKLTLTRYAGTSPTRRRVIARATIAPISKQASEEVAEGTTTKFCQRLDDMPRPPQTGRAGDAHFMGVLKDESSIAHLDIESVIIPMRGRTGTRTSTLCVSSQVGCAMKCGFCETAQMGLIRSLSAEEIVGQWFAATHLKETRIDNIVFMGMGEPMDNADEVIRAISVLTDHNGPAVPMANITVSTVGRIDGLERLGEVIRRPGWHRLGLAVSINAPNDEIRSK